MQSRRACPSSLRKPLLLWCSQLWTVSSFRGRDREREGECKEQLFSSVTQRVCWMWCCTLFISVNCRVTNIKSFNKSLQLKSQFFLSRNCSQMNLWMQHMNYQASTNNTRSFLSKLRDDFSQPNYSCFTPAIQASGKSRQKISVIFSLTDFKITCHS